MPAKLLIDRDGKIADLHVGVVDKAAFESEIQTLSQRECAERRKLSGRLRCRSLI
jgi:hypothetical protein